MNRTQLLKSAKTYLGIKGKRRSNPVTTAKYLDYVPRGRRGRVLEPNSAEFRQAVDNEILRRYASTHLNYSQTITLRARRRFKPRGNTNPAYQPVQVSFTAEGTTEQINTALDEFQQQTIEEWEMDSPYQYERNDNNELIFTESRNQPVRQSGSLMVRTQTGRQRVVPIRLDRLFMKDAGAYKLDSCYIEDDSWDRKEGTCVMDWIYHKYRQGKGLVKFLKGSREEAYDRMNQFFTEYYLVEMEGDNKEYSAITDGVCIEQLEGFCKYFKIPLYAYDKEYQHITRFCPDVNKKMPNPAFIFVIANAHFYPVEDIHFRKSLVAQTRNELSEKNLEWVSEETELKFGEKEGTERPKPIFADGEEIGNAYLMKCIKEKHTIPSKLRVDGSQVQSFMYQDQKYVTRPKDELDEIIERWCEKKEIQYWGQSVLSVLKTLLDEKYGENYSFPELTSKLNPYVYDELTREGVKFRQHYGATENLERLEELLPETFTEIQEEIHLEKKYKDIFTKEEKIKIEKKKVIKSVPNKRETLLDYKVRNGEINCYDLNKAYTSVMYNPLDDFIVYDVDDVVEKYKEKNLPELPTGLYYVETYDLHLLHQSNWYSNKILDVARKYKIDMKITHQLIPKNNNNKRKCVERSFLREFMDYVMEEMKDIDGGTTLYKLIFNSMYGKFGKTKNVNRICNVDNNINEVWRCFLKCDKPENPDLEKHYFYSNKFKGGYNRFKKDDRIICDDISYDKENPLYMFGFEKKEHLMDIQLPIHIQILDWSNILLFQLQKAVGGKCIFRKTDAVMMEGGKHSQVQDGWGGFKADDHRGYNIRSPMKQDRHLKTPDWELRWENNYEYRDSNDADAIIELANEKGGLLICGRAGTGKTHIIKNNKYMTDENTMKMSFTNKASRNCGGTTIHKSLRLNGSMKTQKKCLDKFKFIEYIVIDEIGMVNQDLLNLLQIVKKFNPKIKFILCGDYRQLPPIEESRNMESDIFNHPIVMYLSHHNQIELTERKRYDEPLWNYLERGFEKGDWSGLPSKNVKPEDLKVDRALCFYNKTRERINRWAMESLKPKDAKYLPHEKNRKKDGTIDETDRADSVYLYEGLPVMSVTNNKEHNLINSDEYIVTQVLDDSILITMDGEQFETISVRFDEFHKLFVANYIATTHKSQGATYFNNILLFDSKRMESDRRIKYTAVSRGTALNKIYEAVI
jgi:hypothetical protein